MYAAEAFSNLGDASGTARLVEALASGEDLSARLYAAWTLARLGDLRGRPILDELLQHGEMQVRMQATWTLGQMDDSVAIASLRRALMDEARPVRLEAAWALAAKLHGSPAGAQGGG